MLKTLNTQLWEAVLDRDVKRVKSLLDVGVDVNKTVNGKSWTMLMEVVRWNNVETIKLFLDHGANVEARDENGRTVLMHAAKQYDCVNTKLLLDHGADVFATDLEGKTALSRAESEEIRETLKKAALERMTSMTLPKE